MEQKRSYVSLLKFFIVIFCLIAFCMAFTNQLRVDLKYYYSGGSTSVEFFILSADSLYNMDNTSLYGYILILVSGILFFISLILSMTKHHATILDIVAVLILIGGILLVGLMPIIYKTENLYTYCYDNVVIRSSCSKNASSYYPYLLGGPITAVVFSSVSFVLGCCAIYFEGLHNRDKRKAKKAEKKNK